MAKNKIEVKISPADIHDVVVGTLKEDYTLLYHDYIDMMNDDRIFTGRQKKEIKRTRKNVKALKNALRFYMYEEDFYEFIESVERGADF